MQQRHALRLGAAVLVTALAVTGCGTRGGSGSGTDSGAKVVKIGFIGPKSGDVAALGIGMSNSVELAIRQANAEGVLKGWKLELDSQDDEAKGEVGKNAATALAGDDKVVAVVGTFNSSVAEKVQPVLQPEHIAQVSPANTGPSLTQGADWKTSPKRMYDNYFRTCTTDAVQGPFAARYLYEKLGIRRVATVHDKKTYGQGLVETFTDEFTKLGGKIVAAETINPDDADYNTVISKIKPKSPQVLYFGGESPISGPLSNQMKGAGLKVPLMGGDGMYNAKYLELAGKKSAGDLVTSVGAPVESLKSARKYLDDYAAAGFDDPYEAYGAYAYDAANAIINALKVSLKNVSDPKSARQATIDALGKVSFTGATGKVSFDQYGDSRAKVLTTYRVKGGKWVPVQVRDFAKQ